MAASVGGATVQTTRRRAPSRPAKPSANKSAAAGSGTVVTKPGVTWSEKDKPTIPKGATAFGVRLLEQFVAADYEDK